MSLKDKFYIFLISLLGAVLILLLGKSLKIEWVGVENLNDIRERKGKVLYAFWHGRMLILAYTHRGQKNQVLSSRHRDGQISARIIQRLGGQLLTEELRLSCRWLTRSGKGMT